MAILMTKIIAGRAQNVPGENTIHAAVDCPFVADPAFNRARGPTSIFGAGPDWEF